jgi:hypothetical protein
MPDYAQPNAVTNHKGQERVRLEQRRNWEQKGRECSARRVGGADWDRATIDADDPKSNMLAQDGRQEWGSDNRTDPGQDDGQDLAAIPPTGNPTSNRTCDKRRDHNCAECGGPAAEIGRGKLRRRVRH